MGWRTAAGFLACRAASTSGEWAKVSATPRVRWRADSTLSRRASSQASAAAAAMARATVVIWSSSIWLARLRLANQDRTGWFPRIGFMAITRERYLRNRDRPGRRPPELPHAMCTAATRGARTG
jgi:hypothetical protein